MYATRLSPTFNAQTVATLRSATSLPRRLWGVGSADIAAGSRADLITLAGSPYDDPENLRRVKTICRAGRHEEAPTRN